MTPSVGAPWPYYEDEPPTRRCVADPELVHEGDEHKSCDACRPLKLGSLFSGYGGLDLAVSSVLDTETAWVSDIDKGACKILAHRFPDAPNLGDLTKLDWSAVEPVDIITGGFPCQDLSHAGKRAGMADGTRSGLWSYMCEAINIIRPRLVVAENVRGLLSAEALRPVEPCTWCVGDEPRLDLRALGAVLADLADIGYDASWYGLRAADVGACHGRFRIFLIAYPQSERRAGPEQSRPLMVVNGSQPSHTRQNGRTLLPTPRSSDANGAGAHGDGGVDLRTAIALLPTIKATNNENRSSDWANGPNLGEAIALLPTPAVNDMGKAYTPEEWDAWTAKMQAAHKNGNGHGKSLEIETARVAGFGQYAEAIRRWETVTGRLAPAPTEPTGKNGAHRLSPKFTEWMMGLPPGWITNVPGITRNESLKACGNGVIPQQAAVALRLLVGAVEVAA